jgi:predicted nucleic acid-binding protein
MNLVVDASVAIKWLIEEADTDRAEALLDLCRVGKYVSLAPDLLAAEVSSVLWRRVRQGTLQARQAEVLFASFNRICPVLKPLQDLCDHALQLALTYQHSVYDCLYLALALERRCDLITADGKFHRAFFPTYPEVKLLHDWI